MRLLAFVAVSAPVLVSACHAERIAGVRGPEGGLSRAEYVAACRHERGAPVRLYGCPAWVYAGSPQPLFVVDGRSLPAGTGWWARRRRERVTRTLTPKTIAELRVIPPRDTAALAPYGASGRHGVVVINTWPYVLKRAATN